MKIWYMTLDHIDHIIGNGDDIKNSIDILKNIIDDEQLKIIFRFFDEQRIA